MDQRERLLSALFRSSPPPNLCWSELTKLLIRLGAQIRQGRGSTISVALNEHRAYLSLPHPSLKVDRGALETVRTLVQEAGFRSRQPLGGPPSMRVAMKEGE
jgi:hypothetical protein